MKLFISTLTVLCLCACGDDAIQKYADAAADGGTDAALYPEKEKGSLCSKIFVDNISCTADNSVTAMPSEIVEIKFDAQTNEYSPKCVSIAYGGKVRFTGDFSTNPLREACSDWKNTIPSTDNGNTLEVEVTIGPNDAPSPWQSEYGFYSATHGSTDGTGMAGMITVFWLD